MSKELDTAPIEARLAAVPSTELRVLSNDPFNSELTICKVVPLESSGPIKSAIVGDVAYMTETEETLNYATMFVFARPDMLAMLAEIKRLRAERDARLTIIEQRLSVLEANDGQPFEEAK